MTTSKRVLLLGAETELGAETALALAEAGHILALIASTPDADAAFAVQRLARKLGASSQAIDATNEAAVRVMVRQVAKDLGRLDATVVCATDPIVIALAGRIADREMNRTDGGLFVAARSGQTPADIVAAVAASSVNG